MDDIKKSEEIKTDENLSSESQFNTENNLNLHGTALFGMTSEDTASVLRDFLKLGHDYLTTNARTVEAPLKKYLIVGFAIIVISILIGSMILVYLEKMDASNLALIIGIVLGYLFTMAKNFIGANGN
jgi:hypothetical protein